MVKLLHNLLKKTETEILEFKEAKNQFDRDKLGRYFSALSNEANLKNKDFAYILFGVNDQQEIVGTKISDKTLNSYKQEIVKNTSPKSNFKDIHRVKTDRGEVLILVVPPAPQGVPVSWKGHRYGRDGESLGGLNDFELEQIRLQRQKVDWSAQIVENADITDLSPQALAMAREKFIVKNRNLIEEIKTWDDITFLNKAKLCIKGKITRTAIILLGKPESEHYINPATSKITWILKDKDNIEKDYEHFSCPLLMQVENIRLKIRNLKYRYIKDGSLFPDEVEQYAPYIIREALNNCIAHQDYALGGKINIVENEDGYLTFINSGTFIPGSVEKVIVTDAPETNYRNPFLANAMVNLNMIDTIGSGIKKMFVIQKNKFFPLPDYDFSDEKIKVTITGKVVDINYAKKIVEIKELTLQEIMLLDKVAKQKELLKKEAKLLRDKKLIEGRRPNYIISASVANVAGEKAKYIKQRGVDDEFYMKLMLDYLVQFKSATRADFEEFLVDKLPDVLDVKQKQHKVKNLLQKLKRKNKIKIGAKKHWILNLDEV